MYNECIHITMKQTVLSFRATPRTAERIKMFISQTRISRSECLRVAVDTYLQNKNIQDFLKDTQEIKQRDWYELEEFQRGRILDEEDMF